MIRKALKQSLLSLGVEVRRIQAKPESPIAEMTDSDRQTFETIAPFTMTSVERQWALISAVRYVARRGIPGDIVECGVWRGGSSMAAALTLLQEGAADRDLWLFDTYVGLPRPTEFDINGVTGKSAIEEWNLHRTGADSSQWCNADLAEVRLNMARTGYPEAKTHFVVGKVEETLREPSNIPGAISLLRLDTDFYESTKYELELLFPLLSTGGVLIIDDYGYWEGARKAVDEYFARQPEKYLFHRVDHTGRVAIKY